MVSARLLPPPTGVMEWWLARGKREYGLGLGIALVLPGLAGILSIVRLWETRSFGDLDIASTMRIAIPSVTAIAFPHTYP